jgi:hypothetical protein
VTDRNDRIGRPVADAVPLFWRFMIEKFGVEPGDGHHSSYAAVGMGDLAGV